MRVVSLLPSATELLLEVTGGVRTDRVELVGRSHECDWPADGTLRGVPVLTGQTTRPEGSAAIDEAVRTELSAGRSLYTLDERRLVELRPDVVLTQDLCRVCSIDLGLVERALKRAAGLNAEVVSLNPTTLEGMLDDLLRVGRAVGMEDEALAAAVRLRGRVYRAEEHADPLADGPSVAFLEWTDPVYIGGHWTPQLIERAGARHPLNPTVAAEGAGAAAGPIGQTMRAAGPSVRVPEEVLAASRPEVLIVCPCGLDLERAWAETCRLAQRPWWGDLPAVRNGRVAVVDGNQMFNRPGPRLVEALEWLTGWLNDRAELIPPGFPWRAWG